MAPISFDGVAVPVNDHAATSFSPMVTKRPKLCQWDGSHNRVDKDRTCQALPLNEGQLDEYIDNLCPPWALSSAKQCNTPGMPEQLGKLGELFRLPV